MFQEDFSVKELESAIYYFENDYAEYFISYRIKEQLSPDLSFATDIIMNSDLEDVSYLYRYGEYVGSNELDTAIFLSSLSQEEIESMAHTFTEGYRLGFEAAGIDLSKKKTVNIRYFLGQDDQSCHTSVQGDGAGADMLPLCDSTYQQAPDQ